MSNYTKTTNFAAKDSLPSGNAAKIVKGAEIDTEFNNIATASATKADIAGPTFTGTVTIPTVDLNGGAIDGTTVGASTAAAITGTTIVANTSINIAGDGATVTGIKDEDDMSSNSATKLATQQSIKAYVDSQVTAQDLDVTDGSASIDIDLDSESLGILGGTGIDSTASGTGVTLAIDATVATLAGTQTLTNKTLTSPTLNTPTIGTSFTIGSATITEAELEILDGATVTTAELNVLDGITSTTAELNILDGVTSTAAELNILDGVTSTAAELNILDGVTSTTAEINILDGVTSTTAELNILDGVTSTTAELNLLDGVTATTAELNYVDGVTSNIQQQFSQKAPVDGATFTGTTTIPTADINGGAIDGTVIGGSSAAAGSFTTLGASGAITGTLGTAAQTNITSVGTLSSLTVSGDVTVDTNTLKVDSSNNRVGILNASPDVSLDVGSATDAMHVPVGTTAQRPGSPAAGYFRYNSTTGGFEGYTDAWGAIAGGGGGVAPSIDTMTGDGSDTTLALTNAPVNENATFVTIDGVAQHKSTYSVSGTTLTFSTAPPTGSAVEAITLNTTTINTASILQDADGDTKVQVEESSDEDKIRFDTAGTERMIIDSTGVGIGTTPSRTFHSLGASGISTAGKFEAGGSQVYVQLSSNGQADGDSGYVGYDSSKNLTLFTDNTEVMRITSAGNVGIGTSATSAKVIIDRGASSSSPTTFTTANSYLQLGGSDYNSSGSVYAIGFGYSGGATHSPAYMGFQLTSVGSYTKGDLVFRTRDSTNDVATTERMRIDSAGNVGIGISSPSSTLDISAPANTTPLEINAATDGSNYSSIRNAAGTDVGYFGLGTALLSGAAATDFVLRAQAGNLILMSGGNHEAARFDTSRNFLVGRTSAGATGNGHSIRGGDSAIFSRDSSGESMIVARNASAGDLVRFYCNGSDRGSIDFDGSNTISYTSSSDQRLKENIADADDAGSKIDAIQVRKFDWIADGSHQDYGMIAQELQTVAPEAVGGDPDSDKMMGVDYSKLVPMLVKEIQSLRARVTQLENN